MEDLQARECISHLYVDEGQKHMAAGRMERLIDSSTEKSLGQDQGVSEMVHELDMVEQPADQAAISGRRKVIDECFYQLKEDGLR
jgi:hypothetical protein